MDHLKLMAMLRAFVILLTLSLIASLPSVSIAENPYTGTTSVFVSYSNTAKNPDFSKSPRVYVGFGDSPAYSEFIMDTGSVGIVASADIFQPAPGAKNLGKGRQYYSSSGIIEEGTWWTATQNIYDANGNLLATSNVPVLQVTSIKCAKDKSSCKEKSHPTGIAVMGVGFARESKQQPLGTPSYNAFLNLQSVFRSGSLQPLPADWTNGYVVTPTGVYLGLTAANTQNAGFVKLMPWAKYTTDTLPEWMPAPMTVSANGVSGNGNILMDTGVATAFFSPPADANLGSLVTCPKSSRAHCAPNGDVIQIFLPNQTNPVAYYYFMIGQEGNPMQPYGVHVVHDSNIFLNTSRHVLKGINFLYDNTNGYIGYIWNGLSGSNIGYVKPTINSSTTALASSKNPVKFGKKVTFTAAVVGDDPSITPTGTMTFFIDNEPQDPVQLDTSGNATFSIDSLPPVKHIIVAKYSGDSTYHRSASSPLTLEVKPRKSF